MQDEASIKTTQGNKLSVQEHVREHSFSGTSAMLLRNNIEGLISNGEQCFVDLRGIKELNGTFIDEAFAKLSTSFELSTIEQFVVFEKTDPILANLIANVFNDRGLLLSFDVFST